MDTHESATGTAKADLVHESPDNTLNMPMFGCSSGSGMTNGNVIPKGNKGLVIANLNISSLIKHIDEIRIFLAQHAINILAILMNQN